MLKRIAKNYFKIFSKKDINNLKLMFSKKIILRDWNIEARGLKNVVKANQKIFKSCKSIKVKPLKIYQEKRNIISELLICVDKKKYLLVTDILEFDKQNKIKFIRAYLGN